MRDSDAAVPDSCLDLDQGCVTDTQLIKHELNEQGVSLNLFFCVWNLKKTVILI